MAPRTETTKLPVETSVEVTAPFERVPPRGLLLRQARLAVVRLEGTNVDTGRKLLAASGLDIITASDLTDAAEKAVHASGQ
jgi:succinyl-CoA synthetase beta subunit